MNFKFYKQQLFFLIFFTLISCKNWSENNEKIIAVKDSSFSKKDCEDKDAIRVSIKNKDTLKQNTSMGVVSLKEGYNDTKIIIYNDDGSIWKSFIITDNFEDSNIVPFALKSDDRLLVFQMYNSNNLFYVVKVDEKKNLFKFIKKADKTFIYEPWDKHILKVFSVDFDHKTNPLREKPFDNSKIKLYDQEQFYHPVKVENEWLMIKDDDDKKNWIKWKDSKGSLIITLYYSA